MRGVRSDRCRENSHFNAEDRVLVDSVGDGVFARQIEHTSVDYVFILVVPDGSRRLRLPSRATRSSMDECYRSRSGRVVSSQETMLVHVLTHSRSLRQYKPPDLKVDAKNGGVLRLV